MSMEERFLHHGATGQRPAHVVAGYLAALSIFASAISLAWHPLRLVLVAALLAIVSAGMAPKSRLSLAAALIAAVCFVVGMAIAVVVSHPLW